jgi:hypothetical protein
MRPVRHSFPIVSALALLTVAPAIAPASSGTPNLGASVKKVVSTTATGVVGDGAAGVVSAPGQGLLPDGAATIVRPAGTSDAPGAGEATPTVEAGGAPVVGERLGVTPEGAVRVRTPGGDWQDLTEGASVPNGSTVDARQGTITLTAAVDAAGTQQSAAFSGAQFTVEQLQGAQPVTKLVLRGGNFKACPKAQSSQVPSWSAFAAKAERPVRSVFGSGHGRFRTQGRFAAATVRGTIWQTDDYCDRTMITVKRGVVAVRDLHTGRSVDVRAGSSRTIRRR